MLKMRKAIAVTATAVLAMSVLGVSCDAASTKSKLKAKAYVKPAYVSSGLSKVYVPSYILKGSTVAKGRAFYKSAVPENTLAGIRLGRPANSILAKWGNPSRITVGTAQGEAAAGMPAGPAGPSYIPPGGGTMGMASPSGIMGGMASPGALPALPGYNVPAMPGMPPSMGGPGMPGTTPETGQSRSLSQEEVTWTYDLNDGITLEFIITDGTITQITVGGEGPWGLSKTRTGLQLGDTYKLVLWVNGFPEEPQKYVGRFLRVSYINKNRALYTFLNKKVVGITIALVQQEMEESMGQ